MAGIKVGELQPAICGNALGRLKKYQGIEPFQVVDLKIKANKSD
jgi:hypothetical protein